MREVKFRAVLDGEVFEVTGIDFTNENVYLWNGEQDLSIPMNETILLEYTGLKDRNGTEIYEGDILLVTSEIYTNFGKTPTGRFSKEYYEVIWKDDGWGYKVLKSDHTIEGTEIKGLKVTTKYVEVIGNIYEYPHLLKRKIK